VVLELGVALRGDLLGEQRGADEQSGQQHEYSRVSTEASRQAAVTPARAPAGGPPAP